jgi:hypothetical protein
MLISASLISKAASPTAIVGPVRMLSGSVQSTREGSCLPLLRTWMLSSHCCIFQGRGRGKTRPLTLPSLGFFLDLRRSCLEDSYSNITLKSDRQEKTRVSLFKQ